MLGTRYSTAVIVVIFLGGSACSRKPEPAATIIQTFETSDEGWVPYGHGARVDVTRDSALVKSDQAALAVNYTFNPGDFGSAVLPLEVGQMARTPNLRFWIRTDHATAIIVVLSEKQPGGGYYSSWFWSPKQQWQYIELAPSDFSLNMGPNDPKDPNGRLDLEQVNGLGLSDLGQAFQQIGVDPAYPLIVDRPTGSHTFSFDNLELSSRGVSHGKLLGDPRRKFTAWITLGGAQIAVEEQDNPLKEPATKISYAQTPGRSVVLSHSLMQASLGGAGKLQFRAASAKDSQLLVYLEEKKMGATEGPRYTSALTVAGGSKPIDQTIDFSGFTFDRTGPPDPNGRLDGAELKSISLIDITATTTQKSAPNTLWIGAMSPQ
jgi:hypothetical protein